ncbi:MAG: CDP-diacylglycerol--serine O-phosphatidyltransferase [Candidatus Woesearchaeota archaeon]|jgi:CDP-diacylglycerol--serine O-phosphatidyltransferase
MKIYQIIKFADLFTIGNLLSGVLSIFFAVKGNLSVAAILLCISVFCDGIDGKIARMNKQTEIQKLFGKELDSLADVVSFGVAPAVFGFVWGLQQWWQILILLFFVVAGMLRLARFNVTENKGSYEGIPITVNGILFPVLFAINYFFPFNIYYLACVYLVMAFAMLSTYTVKKVM